jgi:hypothetical protein
MDGKKLKPIILNKRKVKDPARYPKIIIPIENKAKKLFDRNINSMIKEFTVEIVKITDK